MTNFTTSHNFTAGIPISVLDDCCLRFLGELDSEDFKDSVRVFFKIEEAHWFYLDHFCESNPVLPKVPLRDFCEIVCHHFPQLQRFVEYLDEYWKTWKQYKASIPTAGAILLDESLEYVLVLESFPGRRWGFPKGKKNNNESMQECAVREVFEETGYDITQKITPDEYLELAYEDMFVQLFIVHGISRDTVFQPQTKGEVKSFEWMLVKELPGATGPQNPNPRFKSSGFYMIRPFVNPLKRWIEMNRKVILGTDNVPPPPPITIREPSRRTSSTTYPKNVKPGSTSAPLEHLLPHLSPPTKVLVPLSVQKNAAAKPIAASSPTKAVSKSLPKPEALPKIRILRKDERLDEIDYALDRDTNPESQPQTGSSGKRIAFPAFVYPDFVPVAWTPGSLKLDARLILNALKW
ncbi:m7GpppN-mRNA hydrolase [Hypsibius exemplaris]|uniref:mRNA-decapping enzyme 2 n=1 Tax=Hypsibius exemplaris TaxID=2072580 RepID=A0A9X6RK61_HYPEX|nr:m7GpppN-mRNA hydrolase [Hypsibius exemplaris]